MKYEFRRLSPERAKEINEVGVVNRLNHKVDINNLKSVTNMDETIVFRQIWFSHYDDEPDRYFFLYNDDYYYIDIFRKIKGKKERDTKFYYFTYDIVSINLKGNNSIKEDMSEILEILKEIILEWNKYTVESKRPKDEFFVEVKFKGEVI